MKYYKGKNLIWMQKKKMKIIRSMIKKMKPIKNRNSILDLKSRKINKVMKDKYEVSQRKKVAKILKIMILIKNSTERLDLKCLKKRLKRKKIQKKQNNKFNYKKKNIKDNQLV